MDTHLPFDTSLSTGLASSLLALSLAFAGAPAHAQTLEPGEFEWSPHAVTATPIASGPMVIVISLPEQRLHVYRDGVRIGVATISSGKPGNETPTGVYPILQKRREHRSNLYNDAPMPFMQRLTWDGIALHAGKNPGYPASHGCIRLPHAFAERLFELTEHGTLVVVADELSHDADVVYPGEHAPVDAVSGRPLADYGPIADAPPLQDRDPALDDATAATYE